MAVDLYFYATHLLLHLGQLYTWVHSKHHRSIALGPLTAFSFHPLEGILTGGFLPMFFALFELHTESRRSSASSRSLVSPSIGATSSCRPGGIARGSRWLISPFFRDRHHSEPGSNFGAFTTLWDRMFGTVELGFSEAFDAHKSHVGSLLPGTPQPCGLGPEIDGALERRH